MTTLLPEQTKPSRSIKKTVLPIRQVYLELDRRGLRQIGPSRVCKLQVGQISDWAIEGGLP